MLGGGGGGEGRGLKIAACISLLEIPTEALALRIAGGMGIL